MVAAATTAAFKAEHQVAGGQPLHRLGRATCLLAAGCSRLMRPGAAVVAARCWYCHRQHRSLGWVLQGHPLCCQLSRPCPHLQELCQQPHMGVCRAAWRQQTQPTSYSRAWLRHRLMQRTGQRWVEGLVVVRRRAARTRCSPGRTWATCWQQRQQRAWCQQMQPRRVAAPGSRWPCRETRCSQSLCFFAVRM